VFDLDDMFGVRRALGALPECLWDDFFVVWAGLAESSGMDPERMQASLAREAAAARGDLAVPGELATAWETVSDAMRSYLDWKAGARLVV